MADNIVAPEEAQRRLIIFFRIPTETWTDVLAMLSRRILIRTIAPACYRLKEICDKNVRNVHVISRANMFSNYVENAANEPEVKQQLEHLAGNKCHLAAQFRLIYIEISRKNWDAIFRHCSDLLRGCRIAFQYGHCCGHSTFKQAFMTQMEMLKPVSIKLSLIEPAKNSLLEHPTVWKCNRLSLDLYQQLELSSSTFKDIHKWLHRHDHDGHDQMGEEIRFMNLHLLFEANASIDWLFDQCVQNFKQSRKPTDRRKFVLNFTYCTAIDLASFDDDQLIENLSTGEVLLLQLLPRDDRNCCCRLRRCRAEEVGGQKEEELFYEKMFKWNGYRFEFNNELMKTTEVWVY